MTCTSCEYNKERAARWRREAYRLGGTPLPEPEGGTMTDSEIRQRILYVCKVDCADNDFNVVAFHALCDALIARARGNHE